MSHAIRPAPHHEPRTTDRPDPERPGLAAPGDDRQSRRREIPARPVPHETGRRGKPAGPQAAFAGSPECPGSHTPAPLVRSTDTASKPNPDRDTTPDAPSSDIPDLVHRLHAGELDPAELSPDLRRQCVDHLALEGFSAADTGELLRLSVRTVQRDRAATRREHALPPSLTLGDEMLGEYQRLTLASVERLTRLARDPDTPPYARLWAEEAINRMYQRLILTARRLHHLDDGSKRLEHLHATDPAARQRARERRAGVMRDLMGG